MANITPQTITKQLQKDVEIRGQMAAKREEDFKNRNVRAEQFVQEASTTVMTTLSQPLPDNRTSKLQQLHSSIIMGIENDNNEDIVNNFRSRLVIAHNDLQNSQDRKIMKETGGSKVLQEYLERIRILENTINNNQERYGKLEKQCTALTRENTRLKNQYRLFEKDRENLINQLTEAKRDIGILENKVVLTTTEITAVKGELEDLRIAQQNDRMNRMNKDTTTTTTTNNNNGNNNVRLSDEEILHYADSISFGSEPPLTGNTDTSRGSILPSGLRVMDEGKYREVISRLKRLFDAEYRQCKAARNALSNELKLRTEAERLLRTSIAEARADVSRKRTTVQEDVRDYETLNQILTKGNSNNNNSSSSSSSSNHRTTKSTFSSSIPLSSSNNPAVSALSSSSSRSRSNSSSSVSSSTTESGDHQLFSFDEVKVMSRDERQALLIQLLCQDAILNALPTIVFPAREEDSAVVSGLNTNTHSDTKK